MNPAQSALFEGLSNIDEAFLHKAVTCRPNKTAWKRAAAIAATLVFILTAFYFDIFLKDHDTGFDLFSDFPFVSVDANDGETDPFWEEMMGPFNPEYEPKPMFGEHPTFRFNVNLKDWRYEDGDISWKYTLEIHYGDTVVDEHTWNDPHIAYFLSTGDNIPSSYAVLGWFDEPTDITFYLIDVETDMVVQKQVLHVDYLENIGIYETVVTEFHFYKGGDTHDE